MTPRLLNQAKVSLKDLPFAGGDKPAASDETFRWPTLEDLKALKLSEPLKLTEIRVKGTVGGSLSAIQLVFQNGTESPLFDGKYNNATKIQTYKLSDQPITIVSGKAHGDGTFPKKFSLTFKDGSELSIFPQGSSGAKGKDPVIKIPPNQTIVGIYGSISRYHICQLGFIVMEQ